MDKIEFQGFPNCVRLSNGAVELVATTDVGPRILGFSLIGQPNVLGFFPDLVVDSEYGPWKAYGGHRLWIAPEMMPHTYAPDSEPIDFSEFGANSIRLRHPANKAGFEKEMIITLGEGSKADIRHIITNQTSVPVYAAVWTPTIMDGGTAIMPLAPHKAHGDELAPSQSLILWPYTDLSDSRLQLRKNAVCLYADLEGAMPNKVGLAVQQGWAARHKGDVLFVKRFAYDSTEPYTHRGTNCEFFTQRGFLEVESLGPYRCVEPGESLVHVESWELIPNVASVDAAIELLLGYSGS